MMMPAEYNRTEIADSGGRDIPAPRIKKVTAGHGADRRYEGESVA